MYQPRIIGHRGAAGHIAENTLASFKKAFELGAHGIELDVHLSADGQVLVLHDDTLDRTTNGSGLVNHCHLSDAKKLLIDQIHPIPTLEEVFNECPNEALINVEIKDAKATEAVVQLISAKIKSGKHYSNFLVSSFDWSVLELIKNINEQIPLGVLTEKNMEQAVLMGHKIQAKSIHPNFRYLDTKNAQFIKENGFEIHTWTVNEPADIERMKALKVDAIISDFPDRI